MVNQLSGSTLFQDISDYIEQARSNVAFHANSTLLKLYWHIGDRINRETLKHERATYGKQVIKKVALQLTGRYGSGFDATNLSRMSKLVRVFPDIKVIETISQQLLWSHLLFLIGIDDQLKRDFYAEMCRLEKWSVRTLKHQVNGMLYERTAVAKQPEHIIRKHIDDLKSDDKLSPEMIFKDPYILKFEGLSQTYSESDLEGVILNEITLFLQELGNDFCFVARQKRMSTEYNDRYLDLLFFHRKLHRLIAIDLKLGRFEPEHKGQMEWYLNWLDRHERCEREEKPLGIILCADKNQADIEYLSLESSRIHVAQYLTELPPRELFEQRLKTAIMHARKKHEVLENI